MTPFEEELKKALARCEPPEGFTERLAARIGALPAAKAKMPNGSRWAWAAAAMAALVLTGGAVLQQEHAREVKGEEAKQKLLIAMRITNSKLQLAQQQIRAVEKEEAEQ